MVLQTVVVNCEKQVVDFLEGPVNLIKMHLRLIYHTESLVFASDGGAASPKASFGWVLSTNQG